MLYNKDFLLLHYPKTAGTSASVYFCRNFEKPIYGSVSPGLVPQIGLGPQDGVHLLTEGDHWNFSKAQSHLAGEGMDIANLKAVILPIRNPYDLMVSHYGFLRRTYENVPDLRTRPVFKLAAESSFGEFCAQVKAVDFASFLPPDTLSDRIAVEFVRFEALQASFSAILTKYGLAQSYALPHLNRADAPKPYADAYDETSKAWVDKKMDAMFRVGNYPKTL